MDTPPVPNPVARDTSRNQRTLPYISAALLIVLIGGFFVLRGFHQQPGKVVVAHGGSTATPVPLTPTPTPMLWLTLTNAAYVQGEATPIQQFAVGSNQPASTSLTLVAQFTADPQKIHAGDTITLAWEVNGTMLSGTDCCQFQPSPQLNATQLSVLDTATGNGSVKIFYDSVLAETFTFTIISSPTNPDVPPVLGTPTPTPGKSSGYTPPSPCGNEQTPTTLPASGTGNSGATPTPTPHC